jgi:hypothetical protein
LHDGAADGVRIINAVRIYFIAESGLSDHNDERARQILEKLVALGDWAAGEIIGRRDRDEERARSGYFDLKPRLTVSEMLVLRFIRQNPGSPQAAISTLNGMGAAEIGSVVDQLLRAGIVERSADGKSLAVSDAERLRYSTALAELTGSGPQAS